MFKLNFVPILLLIFYKNSTIHILSLYIFAYLYVYNYVLCSGSIVDINTIIVFLNKLNSSLYNPIIFLIICMIVNLFCFKDKIINIYRNLIIINVSTFITNSNHLIVNSITLYKDDVKVEATLTNGLLIIHPLVLYLYYSTLLLFLFYTLYEGVSPVKFLQNYSFNLKKSSFYKIGILALMLGSWWSHQELNWGGFWSWDLVEIFLLITVVYNITLLHSNKLCLLYYYKILFFLINFILYAVSVRFNLINSIHNFFTQNSSLCKITYILLLSFLLFIVFFNNFFKTKKFFKNKNIYYYALGAIDLIYIVLLLYVTVVYIYFYALKSSSNILIYTVPIIVYTLVTSLLAYKTTSFQIFLPFLEASILLTIISNYSKFRYIFFLHSVILLFFLYTFIFYNVNILLSIFDFKEFVVNLSVSNLAQLQSSDIYLKGVLSVNYSTTITNLSLFIENYNFSGLKNSAASLVIYSTPIITNTGGLTIFLHKLFIKLSFIDNITILILVLMFILFCHTYTSPRKSYY